VKGDVLSILEAAYAPAIDVDHWLQDALDTLAPHLDQGFGVLAHRFRVDGSQLTRLPVVAPAASGPMNEEVRRREEEFFAAVLSMPPSVVAQLVGLLYPCAPTVTTQSELAGDMHRVLPGFAVDGQALDDGFGVIASEPSGHGCIFYARIRTPGRVPRQDRTLWLHIAAHLAAGYRLAREPRAVTEAVLDPSGRVQHAEGEATAREERAALSSATTAIDRARGKLRRTDAHEAVALWQGLVRGRWSLVEQFDHDGRRFVVARRNAPQVRAWSTLTPREAKVLAYAAEGQSHKMIAYTLGLSISTISADLTRAARKVGARSRLDLVAMYRGAHPDPHPDPAGTP
jgi:DNA-binding CsgD family transcriptional regulator